MYMARELHFVPIIKLVHEYRVNESASSIHSPTVLRPETVPSTHAIIQRLGVHGYLAETRKSKQQQALTQ